MMENYEETCMKNDHIEQLDTIDQMTSSELGNCSTIVSNDENYNFGAEISKTIITPKQDVNNDDNVNDEIKTTNIGESITSTKTQPAQVLIKFSAPDLPACATAVTQVDSAIGSEQCEYDTAEDIDDDENDEDIDDDEDDGVEADRQSHMYMQNQQHTTGGTGTDNSSDDDSNDTSTDSDYSDLSGLSEVSGKEWKPVTRKPILWVQKQIHSGRNPRELLSRFLPAGAQSIALGLNDMSLWRLLTNMLSEPPRRQKLRHINTFDDVIELILKSENIVVLTGAGVSVSCGIPDFRSSDGIYSRLAKDYPNLPDPQAMFDIDFFSRDPRPFYKFAREIYPGQFKPSPCHRFIKLLEEKQRLLRNYTQNIDTLEQVAGIQRVIECHGSFSTASCTKCKYKCDADAIRSDIFAQRIPVCPCCQPHVHQNVDASDPVSEYDLRLLVANGIMKPDIVFFGEGLPEEFHKVMASDKDKCDLLIVIGSSLKVRPVALIPSSLPANVPQILINREQLNHLEFDVELLGDSDVIINQICHRLGADWNQICYDERILEEAKELRPFDDDDGGEDDEEVENDTLQDMDTQSEKSIASGDVAFRSAGACSDSGFESSTSMGQPDNTGNKSNVNENSSNNIRNSILTFNNETTAKIMSSNENSDFQPFTSRLDNEAEMTPPPKCNENLRHLSIDSTKDSGIQGDSSNSAATPNITSETDGCMATQFNETSTTTAAKTVSSEIKTQSSTSSFELLSKKPRTSKSCSAADFLMDGTYYYYKNSSSYVFPGAQISWYADSESEIEEDYKEEREDQEQHEDITCEGDVEEKCYENSCGISSETQKSDSVNRESVTPTKNKTDSDISSTSTEPKNMTTTTIRQCTKRRSPGEKVSETIETTQVSEVFENTTEKEESECHETPPIKKHRNAEEIELVMSSTTAILTTTINTSNSNNNSAKCDIENSLQVNCSESSSIVECIVETPATNNMLWSSTSETRQEM